MELVISRKILLSGMQTVQRAVAARTTLPILSNILMEARDGILKLFATDLEIRIECEVPAEVKENGIITVPAKLLQELVNNFSSEEMYLKTDEEKQILSISCGEGNYRLNTLTAEEYPSLPEVKKGINLKFSSSLLKDMIKSTIFAAAPSTESRVVLTGVFFEVKEDKLTLVATNAHRLVVKIGEIKKVKEGISKILPTKALQEVSRLIQDEEEVDILISEKQVKFTLKNSLIYSRCIEGQFPPYQQVIPSSIPKITWKVKSADILSSTKRVSSIAKEDTNVVRLRTIDNKLSIEALTQDVGFGQETVNIEKKGEDIEIAFNAEYLLDFLQKAESEILVFELNAPETATVIKPQDEENYFYVIMPIKPV
ncbi:MAG: DNA polymerase III subunit beta [candidate division WS2 bacterium]|nr:DNA polymerase III subunit beta [Candidatus Lithacetigena glycinireducens]